MLVLSDVDQYIKLKNTTDLGLIQDATDLMTRQAKQGVAILAEILQNKDN